MIVKIFLNNKVGSGITSIVKYLIMSYENLKKMVKKSTSEDVLDFDLSRVERVEKEGELTYCRAHVERIE